MDIIVYYRRKKFKVRFIDFKHSIMELYNGYNTLTVGLNNSQVHICYYIGLLDCEGNKLYTGDLVENNYNELQWREVIRLQDEYIVPLCFDKEKEHKKCLHWKKVGNKYE